MASELLGFGVAPAPSHDRRKAYDASDKGKERHKRYRTTEKGKVRDKKFNEERYKRFGVEYEQREFVAWDGEGINEVNGAHTYVLLASSLGDQVTERNGIGTRRVLDLFLTYAGDKRIHVGYGLNYDINMWLKDLGRDALHTLYTKGSVWWRKYRIEWRGGKSFSVYRNGKRFLIYDVLPFFQRSFVAACDEYLGTDWPFRDQIIAEKAKRGDFDFEDITNIQEYNGSELVTLVRLCEELRRRLNKVHIRVNRWDGPGAIATALYRQYGIKSSMCETPEKVNDAARYGYAGGRFEIVRKGHTDAYAFQYDIRSAYPSAMRELPCLAHGTWSHVVSPTDIAAFGIYRIEVHGKQVHSTRPQPLWHRNKNGTVYFSDSPHGWYWSPEARIGASLANATVHEGWVYDSPCNCNPFGFVEPLYNKRAALKRAGDGAHIGLKLGLNSLYGKLAQQIGWDLGPPLRLPPFHCLEWAGFVTSHCRAQVYSAAMTAPDDIIAFETDAVFSRVPLDLDIGEHLGQWDETIYSSLTYLKSGMYWGTKVKESGKVIDPPKEIEKTRGINKGSIPRSLVIEELRNGQRPLPAEQTRFVTLGQALHQNFDLWTHWVTSPRNISVALWGKRIDVYDGRDNYARKNDGWEETIGGPHDTEFSYPYEVEWLALAERLTGDVLENELTIGETRQMESHLDLEGIFNDGL